MQEAIFWRLSAIRRLSFYAPIMHILHSPKLVVCTRKINNTCKITFSGNFAKKTNREFEKYKPLVIHWLVFQVFNG